MFRTIRDRKSRRRRRNAAALSLAIGACLAISACGNAPDRNPAPAVGEAAAPGVASRPRLVVLGLDAGTWDLLGPWMDKGLLPNLARLRASGVHGNLRSTQPSSSPVIWTSIATGKVPDKTGITWFVRFPNGLGNPVPVDRTMRRTRAIWNILGQYRIDVAVLGWYVTWPAEEVNGRLLSDIAHFGQSESSAWPAHFLWDLKPVPESDAISAMPRFMDFAYDPARAVKPDTGKGETPSLDYLVYDRFLRAWARDRFYLEAAERTLSDGLLPEALFLYLRGTDDVQHGFWKFMDPGAFASKGDGADPVAGTTEVPPEQVAAFAKVIERYWQWIDEGVGRILSRYAKTQPLVFVCSDHGAGPAVGDDHIDVPEYLHLSGAHRADGFLIASGPGIRAAEGGTEIQGATIYDVVPTILHALSLPVAKDMDGRVLEDIFSVQRPVSLIDTYDSAAESGGAAPPDLPPDVDAKVLEHLRSLGYIE